MQPMSVAEFETIALEVMLRDAMQSGEESPQAWLSLGQSSRKQGYHSHDIEDRCENILIRMFLSQQNNVKRVLPGSDGICLNSKYTQHHPIPGGSGFLRQPPDPVKQC